MSIFYIVRFVGLGVKFSSYSIQSQIVLPKMLLILVELYLCQSPFRGRGVRPFSASLYIFVNCIFYVVI